MAAFAMVVHNFSLEAKHGICLMFGLFSEVNLANHSGIQTFDPIPTAYNACPPHLCLLNDGLRSRISSE